MKRIFVLSPVLLSFILVSCASLRMNNDERMLKAELNKLANFEGEGIAELSAFGFSLRKPFSLKKSAEEMRLDLIEGGILGGSGSPMLSVYLGKYLAMNSNLMPALANVALDEMVGELGKLIFAPTDFIFDKYGAEIIEHKTLERDGIRISFAKDYKVESLKDTRSNLEIRANYDRRGELDYIELKTAQAISAKLVFDNVNYQSPSIIPLPKNENGGGNLMDLFKGNDMFKLLKMFMGD